MRKILFFYVVAFCVLSGMDLCSMQKSPELRRKLDRIERFLKDNPEHLGTSANVLMDLIVAETQINVRTHVKYVEGIQDELKAKRAKNDEVVAPTAPVTLCVVPVAPITRTALRDVSNETKKRPERIDFTAECKTVDLDGVVIDAPLSGRDLCPTIYRKRKNQFKEQMPCVYSAFSFLRKGIGYPMQETWDDIEEHLERVGGDEQRFKDEFESRYRGVDLGPGPEERLWQAIIMQKMAEVDRVAQEERYFLGSLVDDLGEPL